MHRTIAPALFALALATGARGATAGDAPPPPTVTVSASAPASVANDRLQASLRAEAENASAAAAASEVNARVAKALARMKATPGFVVETSGYTTQQIAERGRPSAWRVAQSVSIEGNDFAAIGALVTKLQAEDGLLLSGLSFTVSEDKRRATEDALTQQAIAGWRARAQNAARALGFSTWRPGRVAVSGNDSRPPPFYRGGVAAMGAPAAPVPLEAGATDVTVTVTGDAVLESPSPR
jgi:predicted secreted protein